MSLSAVLDQDIQRPHHLSKHHDDFVLRRIERKHFVINGLELDAERISGKVVGSRVTQHNQIYTTHHNNFMANGDNHVYSTVQSAQWETSEVRLRFEDGTERLFKLPFAISVGEDDLVSIISLYRLGGDGYAVAAQNHNISQSFCQDRDGLQLLCARLGLFKPSKLVNNRVFSIVLALLAISLYALSHSILLALIGGVLLSGLYVVAVQYLVLLPYVLAVWPKINKQLQLFFDDFSPW